MTDSFDFSKEYIGAARKEYPCCECDEPILKGERYENIFGVYERIGTTFRTHLRCRDHREKVRKAFDLDLMPLGDMMREIEDIISQAYSTELSDIARDLGEIDFNPKQEAQINQWLADANPWCEAQCGQFKESFKSTCGDWQCVKAMEDAAAP